MEQSAEAASKRRFAHVGGPLPIDKIIERYEGQWVLMRVTSFDEDGWPAIGFVVAMAPTQREIVVAHEGLPIVPGEPYCSFQAYPDIQSGPEYEDDAKRFLIEMINALPYRGG